MGSGEDPSQDTLEGVRDRPARPGRAETLTDRAYREIEERIVTMQLRPGTLLSEAMLTESLGIGRTPIREALQRLAIEDLVVIMPRRGVMVSEINVSRQLLLVETRRALEHVIMVKAAERATARERETFRVLAADFARSAEENDATAFMRHDQQLNRLSVETCRNPYVTRMATMIQGLSRRFWYRYFEETLDLPRCARLHRDEAQAIADADPKAAAAAVDALLDYTEEFTRASVQAGGGRGAARFASRLTSLSSPRALSGARALSVCFRPGACRADAGPEGAEGLHALRSRPARYEPAACGGVRSR